MAARHRFGGGTRCPPARCTPALARLIAELSGAAERARRGVSLRRGRPGGRAAVTCSRRSRTCSARITRPSIAAAEADPALARLVRRRLLVHGVPSVTWTSGPGPSCPTSQRPRT